MTIKEAGKDIVKNGYHSYLIGFNGNDETSLDATNIDELEELWYSLCSEFECGVDSIDYIVCEV